MHIDDTERLVTEIEMVKVVLRLVRLDMCTKKQQHSEGAQAISG
jgi:hypothetical protein